MIGRRGCDITDSSENTYRTIAHALVHRLDSNTDIQTRVCAVPIVCHNGPSCGYSRADHIVGDRRRRLIDRDRGSTWASLRFVTIPVRNLRGNKNNITICKPGSRTVRKRTLKLCCGDLKRIGTSVKLILGYCSCRRG